MAQALESEKWKWGHSLSIGLALVISVTYAFLRVARQDEVSYVDPGAQLVLVGRMESAAWLSNSPLEPWGASNPGMPLLFAAWFKVFGFGLVQARVCFVILHLLGIFFLFRWINRTFTPPAAATAAGIIAALILPSLANAIFLPRLDAFALLLFAWFLNYAWRSESGVFVDWAAAPILGTFTVFLGFHFSCFFALAAATVFLLSPSRRAFMQGIGLAAGILVGVLLLWIFYQKTGRWTALLEGRASHFGRVIPWDATGWKKYLVTVDMPFWAVLALLGLKSATDMSRTGLPRPWLPWIGALAIFIIVPQLIGSIGIYYGSYAWMASVPMLVFFYGGTAWLNERAKAFISIAISLIFVSMGLFYAYCLPWLAREAHQRSQVLNAVEQYAAPRSSIAADFSLYYDLVGAGYRIFPRVTLREGDLFGFTQERYFPSSAHDSIVCIAARAASADEMIDGVGGRWRLVAELPVKQGERSGKDYQVYIRE